MENHDHWYYIPRPNPHAALKIFCFSYAGGSASTYIPYAHKIERSVELVAIQLPGRGARFREKPYTSLTNLVTDLADILLPIIDRPFIVFGHSFGARLSFELCNALQQRNISPIHFIGSGSRAVHLKGDRLPIYNLETKDFCEKLKLMGGTPAEILSNSELMNILIPMLRSDFQMSETHIANKTRPFPFKASFFYGIDDKGVPLDSVLPWQLHFDDKISLYPIHGNHFFIDNQREQVIRQLNSILASQLNILSNASLQP